MSWILVPTNETDTMSSAPIANMGVSTDGGLASPSLSSGNATPQMSVTDGSTSIHAPSRINVVTPGNRTSTNFTKPAPPNHTLATDGSKSISESQQLLISHLMQFTQTISDVTSLGIQRDLAKIATEKREKEDARWQVQYGDFSSLAEEQAKDTLRRKAIATHLDEKFKQAEAARDQAIRTMVTSLLAASSTTSGHVLSAETSERSGWPKREINDLKAEVKALQLSHSTTVDDSSLKDVRSQVSLLSEDLSRTRSLLYAIQYDADRCERLQNDYTSILRRIRNLEDRYHPVYDHPRRDSELLTSEAQQGGLATEITKLQTQLDVFKPMNNEIGHLQQNTNSLSEEIQSLKERVLNIQNFGPNVVNTITDQKDSISNLQNVISAINTQLGAHSGTLTAHEIRIASTESVKSLETSLPEVSHGIVRIDEELVQIRIEQEEKDDLIGKEIERVDQELSGLRSNLAMLKKLLDITNRTVNSNYEKFKTEVADLSMQLVAQPQQMQLALQDNLSLVNHRDRLFVCETTLRDLQSRFDNLSTADLARCMVNQMQTMYPYPAYMSAQLQQLTQSNEATLQSIRSLREGVTNIALRVENSSTAVSSDLHQNGTGGHHTTNHDNKDEQRMVIQKQINIFSKELQEKVNRLQSSVDFLNGLSDSTSRGLEKISTTIGIAKTEYETTVKSMQSNISTLQQVLTAEQGVKAQLEGLKNSVSADIVGMQNRMKMKEDAEIEQLASLQGDITWIKEQLEKHGQLLTQQDSNLHRPCEPRLSQLGNLEMSFDDPLHVANEKPAVVAFTSHDSGDISDDEPPRQAVTGRSIVTKKKTKSKRRRGDDDDSDFDYGPPRKSRAGGFG